MKWFWAGLAVGGLAISGADAKCNCNFLNPRLDAPTIGTRSSQMGPLSESKSADTDVSYLGCDIKYWNIPKNSSIKVVWNFYESDDDKTPEGKSKGAEPRDIDGNGTLIDALYDVDGFPDGIFECEWTVESGGKKVDNSPATARITVGNPKAGKKKGKGKPAGDDDDKGGGKKKKKKGDDDDDDK